MYGRGGILCSWPRSSLINISVIYIGEGTNKSDKRNMINPIFPGFGET